MFIRCATAAALTGGGPAQTIAVASGDGSTIQPKAAIYELTSTTTLDATGTHRRHGIGITDGTDQRCVGVIAEGGIAAVFADAGTRANNAAVIDFPLTTSEAVDGVAAWTSWQNGGSAITWSDFPATACQIKATYFFGDDIECKVVEFAYDGGTGGEQEITGAGFQPNFAFAITFGDGSAAFPASTGIADLNYSFGYAVHSPYDGDVEAAEPPDPDRVLQFCYADMVNDRNAGSTSGTTRFASDSFVCPFQDIAGLGAYQPLTLTRFTNDGAFVDNSVAPTSADRSVAILFIRFKKHKLFAGVATQGESGDFPVAAGSLPNRFRPQAYFAVGTAQTTINGTGDTSGLDVGRFSHGVYTGTENVFVSGVSDDAVASSLTASRTGDDSVWDVRTSGAAQFFAATHVSFEDDGFIATFSGTGLDVGSALYYGIVSIGGMQLITSDSETITESQLFFADPVLIVTDSVSIVDEAVISGAGVLVFSDTVQIEDGGNFAGDALLVTTDSETITEDEQEYLGNLIVDSDTVNILEDSNFGTGPGRIKSGGARGSTFQGGAEEGSSFQGGAERGTVIGG